MPVTIRLTCWLGISGLTGSLALTLYAADATTVLRARSTAGIAEDGSSGDYGVTIACPDEWPSMIVARWDNGSAALRVSGSIDLSAARLNARYVAPDNAGIGSAAANADAAKLAAEQARDGVAALGVGTGDIAVNHDTGGVDNLRYHTADDSGIDDAAITAYVESEYAAGLRVVRDRSRTNASGRWRSDMHLSAETYRFVFDRAGYPSASKVVVVE